MRKFSADANAVHNAYGVSSAAASRETRAAVAVVAMMVTSRMPMTTSPQPGRRRPKNVSDQPRFRPSCSHHSHSAAIPILRLLPRSELLMLRRTSHAANAIHVYSTVHTGPKTASGGFQTGLRSVRYQVGIARAVDNPPRPAAAKLPKRYKPSQGRCHESSADRMRQFSLPPVQLASLLSNQAAYARDRLAAGLDGSGLGPSGTETMAAVLAHIVL